MQYLRTSKCILLILLHLSCLSLHSWAEGDLDNSETVQLDEILLETDEELMNNADYEVNSEFEMPALPDSTQNEDIENHESEIHASDDYSSDIKPQEIKDDNEDIFQKTVEESEKLTDESAENTTEITAEKRSVYMAPVVSAYVPSTEVNLRKISVSISNPPDTLESLCVELEGSDLNAVVLTSDNNWTASWELRDLTGEYSPRIINALGIDGELLKQEWDISEPSQSVTSEAADLWTEQSDLTEGVYKFRIAENTLLASSWAKNTAYGTEYYALSAESDSIAPVIDCARWNVANYGSYWIIQNCATKGNLAYVEGRNSFGAIISTEDYNPYSGFTNSLLYSFDGTTPRYFRYTGRFSGSEAGSATGVRAFRLEKEIRNLREEAYVLQILTSPITADVRIAVLTEGNISDPDKLFNFTILFSDGRAPMSFALKHGQVMLIAGIPIGSTVTVCEDSDGYTVRSSLNGLEAGTEFVISPLESSCELIFTNHLSGTIEVGIWLDSVPYIILLCVISTALFIRRKIC